MFERFTTGAREVVVGAQLQARELGHGWIGAEHLLLSAVTVPDDEVATALRNLGLTRDAVAGALHDELGEGQDDSAALRDLGIDLDAVRRRVEERFGAGALERPDAPSGCRLRRRDRRHIPFTAEAKKALELSLREALRLHAKEIRVEHLVLGLVRTGGLTTRLLGRLGVRPDDVRAAIDRLGRAA